jgi:putative membrane protein (TIGR04086 family)
MKHNFIYIGEGVFRSIIFAFILMLAYSIISLFFPFSDGITSMVILVSSMLSIIYGTLFATKKIQKKGWLIGIAVAFLYMVLLYLITVISKESDPLNVNHLLRFSLAMVVGALSGMLGINV